MRGLISWLYDRFTSYLDVRVTEAPHPPTVSSKSISNRFVYHPPTEKQIKTYGSLRTRAKEFAFLIEEVCPDSDERDYALHYLDMVVMNANAAIARHTPGADTIARHGEQEQT
jgi:hypothetical protein